ncbi:glycosyltransferase family 39 protein [bacterium]|nr:glycosyltransferase family 39 protein [bacterium]
MWLGLILISAFFVRFTHFGIHRFHEDEALYASWGIRIFEHYDLLLNGASGVDKPPLLFYLQAIAYLFFGITENAARIPNLIAGVVSVSLIYKIGKYYFNEKTGLVSAWLMAISPLHIAYSNTAFTDMTMVMLGLAGIAAMTSKRFALAGVLVGLSLATKQFGVFWVPLIIVLLMLEIMQDTALRECFRDVRLKSFLKGFFITIGSLLLITAFSNPFWGFMLYLHKSSSTIESTVRGLTFWMSHYEKIFELPLLNIIGYVSIVWLVLINSHALLFSKNVTKRQKINRIAQLMFVVFIAGYLVSLLLLKPFQYVRYAVLWVPFVVLISGAFLVYIENLLKKIIHEKGTVVMAIIFLIGCGMLTFQFIKKDTLQYGAFYRSNDGIEQVAAYLREIDTDDKILLMRDSGWCYKFYANGISFFQKQDVEKLTDIIDIVEKNSGKKIFITSHLGNEHFNNILKSSGRLEVEVVLKSERYELFLLR